MFEQGKKTCFSFPLKMSFNISYIYVERCEGVIEFSVNDVHKVRKKSDEAGWVLLCVLYLSTENRSRVCIEVGGVGEGSAATTQVTVGVKHSSCLMIPQKHAPFRTRNIGMYYIQKK